ncbi:MFS transporter [Patescibacteria group bacterium]|nr:MFS transporter [Patescibacteria group bacterium]
MLIGYNLKDKPIPAELKQMNIRKSVKDLFSHKVIALFLVGYFLYSDAVQTFGNNFPLYLEKVHMVSDTQKSILAASILLCASLSAFFTGKRADRIGLKKSLMIILIVMCIVFPIFAFIK